MDPDTIVAILYVFYTENELDNGLSVYGQRSIKSMLDSCTYRMVLTPCSNTIMYVQLSNNNFPKGSNKSGQ